MIKTTNEEAAAPVVTTVKNFKSSSDVENFYRFINDNKLRDEAKKLVEVVLKQIAPPKRRGRKKNIQ